MTQFTLPRRLSALLSTAAITGALVVAAGPSGGAAATASTDPSDTSACTLAPSAHRSEHHEWASCLSVSATLDSAPMIGETATLSYEVTAAVPRPGARISIELPEGLEFVQAPSAARLETRLQSDGTGNATYARLTDDLDAEETVRGSAVVRATSAGLKSIKVVAIADQAAGTDGADDAVHVTIGAAGQSSRFGGEPATSGGTIAVTGVPAPRASGDQKIATVPADVVPHSDDPVSDGPGTDANTCVAGSWHYYDNTGALQPSINYQVQAWDADSSTDDDLLDTAVTNFSGGYELCFDGLDGEGGGQEVYVLFISENSTWRVRNNGTDNANYRNVTGTVSVCDGCYHDYGSLVPSNDIHRGMHAFDSANDFWAWMPHSCWDRDSTCRQAVINWTATSTDGTYYSLGSNDVHLAADDPNSPHTVVHELTHSTMDDAFDDDYPAIPSCSPHYIQNTSSQGCAWTEGFAEYVPAAVYDDPYFRWPNGSALNLETPTWGTAGWDNGDSVEGRIAGALIDIDDSANEDYWDRWAETDNGPIWDTFQSYVLDTFPVFWYARAVDGYDTSHAGAGAGLYQNTIDYSFRDPLPANTALNRPTPLPHNFSFETTTSDWSLVALKPPVSSNYNLSVYDDFGQTTLLDSSSYGTGVIDFVAVDSNHRALDTLYPRSFVSSGSGVYSIEYDASSGTIGQGVTTVSLGSTDLALIRDISLTGGQQTAIRVDPGSGSQNPDVFVMDSDPASSPTFVRGRSDAVASASSGGAGATETVIFTPSASDTYGLAILNAAGSGSHTVYVDSSAPTGSLVIEDGDNRTPTREVSLSHNVSDAQTGVAEMRVSVDGAMDTEPWVAFDAESEATLPGGDGVKTVRSQYRNGAGLQSAVVSDTIDLDQRPDLTTKKVSNPPNRAERGEDFEIEDTVKNVGTNKAGASISKFYLSADKNLDANDIAFSAKRDVPSLKNGKQSKGTTEVTVKGSTPLDRFYVLACADGTDALDEYGEGNNCKASKQKVEIVNSAPRSHNLPR